MAIITETLVHEFGGDVFESVIVRNDADAPSRPGVLVVPNVLGLKAFDVERGERLAVLGYIALVVDLYGQGKRTKRGDPDMSKYMNTLNADRELLRDRMHHALAVLRSLSGVDMARTAAIGFCFGGKAVLDLARSGADVRGVVSFHGVYDRPPFANAPIMPKLLICHGWNDPLCPPEMTVVLANELTEAGADWQLHAYGGAGHAFTDNSIAVPGFGLDENADQRSWQEATNFLATCLD